MTYREARDSMHLDLIKHKIICLLKFDWLERKKRENEWSQPSKFVHNFKKKKSIIFLLNEWSNKTALIIMYINIKKRRERERSNATTSSSSTSMDWETYTNIRERAHTFFIMIIIIIYVCFHLYIFVCAYEWMNSLTMRFILLKCKFYYNNQNKNSFLFSYIFYFFIIIIISNTSYIFYLFFSSYFFFLVTLAHSLQFTHTTNLH